MCQAPFWSGKGRVGLTPLSPREKAWASYTQEKIQRRKHGLLPEREGRHELYPVQKSEVKCGLGALPEVEGNRVPSFFLEIGRVCDMTSS